MKTLLIVFLLTVCAPAQTAREEFTDNVLAFHHHWDAFMRDLFGCDPHAVNTGQCDKALATMNYREFLAARKAAKELFDLEDGHHAVAQK